MVEWIKVAFVLGLFALVIALLFPTLIGVGETDASESVALQQGEFIELTDRLSVAARDVHESQDEVTIRYRNEQTYERLDVLLNNTTPAENKTVQLSGENITVELAEIDDNSSAIVSTTYPPMFSWDDGPQAFWEESGLIIALLAALVIIGILLAVGRSL